MTAVLPPPTRRRDATPAEIRATLKSQLGYNARQVTVSAPGSNTYVTITIRDASVDVEKVQALAKSLHTWSISQDDVASGQSVHVKLTDEVRAALAAPFIPEITAALQKLAASVIVGESDSIQLSTGAFLCRDFAGRDIYVCRVSNQARGNYVWAADALALAPSAVLALALQAKNV